MFIAINIAAQPVLLMVDARALPARQMPVMIAPVGADLRFSLASPRSSEGRVAGSKSTCRACDN